MKRLTSHIASWTCPPASKDGILLFVQRARELLIHHTSLVRKPLNSSAFMCSREIIGLLTIKSGGEQTGSENAVKQLHAELLDSIGADEIAKQLLGPSWKRLAERIINDTDIRQRLEAANLLRSKLTKARYISESAKAIASIIRNGSKEKDRLNSLTECVISAVIDAGYQPQTAYHLINTTFFDRKKESIVADENSVIRYFEYFDLSLRDYEVVLASDDRIPISGDIENFKVIVNDPDELTRTLQSMPASQRRFLSSPNEPVALIKITGIKSLEPQSARSYADNYVKLISDFVRIDAHKKEIKTRNGAVVFTVSGAGRMNANRSKPAMHRVPIDSNDNVDPATIFRQVSAATSDSRDRIVRAVKLHAIALSSADESSQLVNLWIAFESLFLRGKKSKIEEVLSGIVPLLTRAWWLYEPSELLTTLLRDHNAAFLSAKQSDPRFADMSDLEALIALYSVREIRPAAEVLLDGLKDDPLLRYEFGKRVRSQQTARGIRMHLDEIAKKVERDVHRMYRYRNQIVHLGDSPRDLSDVVQRAHHFLDVVFTMLRLIIGESPDVISIDQAVIESSIGIDALHDRLQHYPDQEKVSLEEYRHLFGLDLLSIMSHG